MSKELVKIAFAEGRNDIIEQAVFEAEKLGICEGVLLNSLEEAFLAVKDKEADAVIAGIDYTTRDVIIAARDNFGLEPSFDTFSSFFSMKMSNGQQFILADAGVTKDPDEKQLTEIVLQTVESAQKIGISEPRVAMLSFSTCGSGGKHHTIDKISHVVDNVRRKMPDLIIDGEIQLDAAVNPSIGRKKAPGSSLQGNANILITPDLTSGNILYKSLQHFGGAEAYGPVLQGFNGVVSDLSRGSTKEDVLGAIKIVVELVKNTSKM